MAKGQQRSNREPRKPKKEKAPKEAPATFGAQLARSGKNDNTSRRKPNG